MSFLNEKRKISSTGRAAPKLRLMETQCIAILPSFIKQVPYHRLASFAQDSRQADRSVLLSLARLQLSYNNTT